LYNNISMVLGREQTIFDRATVVCRQS
jgi:hypothetical protein